MERYEEKELRAKKLNRKKNDKRKFEMFNTKKNKQYKRRLAELKGGF